MGASDHRRRGIERTRRVWGRSAAMILFVALLGLAVSGPARAAGPSPIKADEDVLFFPGFATQAMAPSWTGFVRGWIFEPVRNPAQRTALTDLLREKLNLSRKETGSQIFLDRTRMFLVDNERSKYLSVSVAGRTVVLAPSQANGHFEDQITLQESAAKSGDWIEIRAVTRPGDGRTFTGGIQLIGRQGVSVVSDIDDTIKVSNVLDKPE